MGLNDWIYVTPVAAGAETRSDEIDQLAKTKLSEAIQSKVRARVDPGIDLRSAGRAQAVRSYASDGRIVIDEQDQGEVLTGSTKEPTPPGTAEADSVEDLYSMSSGIPEVIADPDGTSRISFRTIRASALFGEKQIEQDESVQGIVTETLQMGIVDAVEEATADVLRRFPEK